MNEAKHTPGPWSVEPYSRDSGHQITVPLKIDNVCIAIAPDLWDCDGGRATCEANAHLIAAAPDLLAALKEVVRISDRKHDAWDAARVAIAKAEGPSANIVAEREPN
jgi:hypothetical protein